MHRFAPATNVPEGFLLKVRKLGKFAGILLKVSDNFFAKVSRLGSLNLSLFEGSDKSF